MGEILLSHTEVYLISSSNTWAGIFSSRSTDIGSNLPFWAVQEDFTPGVNTATIFCGGWTNASAKQYNISENHFMKRRQRLTLVDDSSLCGWGPGTDSFL